MKFLVVTIFSCLFLFNHPALANADMDKVEQDWSSCLEQPGGESTLGSIYCASVAYDTADVALNALYQKIMSGIKLDLKSTDLEIKKNAQDIKNRLVAAQRAWITFRDTNCSLQGIQMLGGTGENQIISGCLAQTTINRVNELSSIFLYDRNR